MDADAPRLLRWETLTKRRFDQLDRAETVVVLTCSPMEVHGPHLPLGADALEGQGLIERTLRFLPERHRGRTFVGLPLVYTATDVVPQPGSLHFRPSTTVRVLSDLGRTLAAQGFRHVWISNFHGGPRHFLSIERACQRVHRRFGLGMVSIFSLMIARLTHGSAEAGDVLAGVPGVRKEDLEGDTHGGLLETSQLLALCGQWVDPEYKSLPRRTPDLWLEERGERRTEVGRGDPRRFLEMMRSFRAGVRFFEKETYSGAPAGASPELGEAFLDVFAGHTAEACGELLDGRIGPEQCHSPLWRWRFLFLNPAVIRLGNRLVGLRNPLE